MTTHFARRCRERGITETDTGVLFRALAQAIEQADNGTPQDLVERVLTTEEGRFWRFRCAEGIFYAITKPDGNRPMTVYTQEMFSNSRRAHKRFKRQRKAAWRGNLDEKPVEKRVSGRSWRNLC